jgi:hypothetical protein
LQGFDCCSLGGITLCAKHKLKFEPNLAIFVSMFFRRHS